MTELSSQLPQEILRAVKRTWVPAHIVTIFSNLPEPLDLEARVAPSADQVPLAARQLLKLASVAARLHLQRLEVDAGGQTSFKISRPGSSCALGADDLERGFGPVVRALLQALFDAGEFPGLVEGFAFQSSTLATLQAITNHMLQTTDMDKALFIMLSGLTSGYSLGFNRAALFTYDDVRRRFIGSKAIGPYDGEEAHRIWEEIEEGEKDIEGLIEDYARQRYDTRFQQFVQVLELSFEPEGEDEVAEAIASRLPLIFRRTKPRNRSLRRLATGDEFVVAALQPHGRTLGLIFADNLYNAAPISDRQLKYLSFFIDQTALVWENLALLKSVEELARYDGLTGLYNRREFELRFAEERARSDRAERPCGLLLIDVDHFKQVNDTQGHPAGDALLKTLGDILRREVRVNDLAGRMGGDEFAVFCSDLDQAKLEAAALRIGRAAKSAGISISVGGAGWPGSARHIDELVEAADARLYRCKGEGKGCACVGDGGTVAF